LLLFGFSTIISASEGLDPDTRRNDMKKLLSLVLALAMMLCFCAVSAETEEDNEVYEYTETDIVIDAGDHQIPATLTLPVGAEGETFPAVVMLHGNGSTRHEAGNAYDYTAPIMATAGIATIRFDYIGNGDSTSDYIDFTYDKGVEDALKCYEYLTTIETVDAERVGIMGWSQGGRLTILTAARSDVFKSALTWAGAFDQKGNEEEQYAIAKENGYYEVTYSWRDSLRQSPAYYECAMAIDYYAEAAKITIPFLAIQGDQDDTVLPETAQTIVDALVNSADAEVYYVEGAGHTFGVFSNQPEQLEEITVMTIMWFLLTL